VPGFATAPAAGAAAAPAYAAPASAFGGAAAQPAASFAPAQAAPAAATAASAASAQDGRKRFRVIFDYNAEAPDELSLRVNDVVALIREDSPDWWTGEVNGRVGMFPTVFIDKTPLPGALRNRKPRWANAGH